MGARRETVQVAVGCDVERIGEPGIVAFAFLRQLLQDRVRGFRGRLPFLGRVIARFRKSGQTAGEPFLDGSSPVSGSNVERSSATYSMELPRSSNRSTPVSYTGRSRSISRLTSANGVPSFP